MKQDIVWEFFLKLKLSLNHSAPELYLLVWHYYIIYSYLMMTTQPYIKLEIKVFPQPQDLAINK